MCCWIPNYIHILIYICKVVWSGASLHQTSTLAEVRVTVLNVTWIPVTFSDVTCQNIESFIQSRFLWWFSSGEAFQFSLDLWGVHLVAMEAGAWPFPPQLIQLPFRVFSLGNKQYFFVYGVALGLQHYFRLCNYSSGSVSVVACGSFFASGMPESWGMGDFSGGASWMDAGLIKFN